MKKAIRKTGKVLVEILKQLRPTKQDLKEAGLTALIVGSVGGLIGVGYLSVTYFPNKIREAIYNSTQHIYYKDVTSDGREDIVLTNPKKGIYEVLVQKPNGLYERGKIKEQDGMPFIVTEGGIYDPYGHFFKIESVGSLDPSKR